MICPKCGGTMNGIAFITEYAVADYRLLKLRFVEDKPLPPHVFEQVALMLAIIRYYKEWKSIVFFPGAAGFLIVTGSSGTISAAIDSVARPTI